MTDMSFAPRLEDSFEELSSPKREIRKGLLVAGAFFVGLLGWAALTPLDAGAIAQGVVAVSGNRQAVQHRDGGIVTALHVTEGQLVKQGQLLATISASELVAAERGMTGEYVNLLAQRARLHAERDGAAHMGTPAAYAELGRDDRAMAAAALRGQRALFYARRNSLGTERGVIGQRIGQFGAQIDAYRHQMRANQEQQRLIDEELSGLRTLEERGFVATNRIRAMERAAAELNGNYGAHGAEIARSSEAIGEARLQMVSLDRKLLEDAAGQLRDVEVRIGELRPKLLSTREQLKRAHVRAPATGRVVGLNVFTVGGVVAPGERLMEIVPLNRALVIEAKASPTDADDLRIGMETQVRFSAIQERNLPVLHGKISKVSADSFEDERTGARHFTIEVIVPPGELDKIRQVRGDIAVKAGLPAEVLVPLRKRTALGYLTEPLTQMLWLAGREH
jgi:HlyD family type I secretion membrane fusion protein